jgi:hypothetical protein
VDVLPGPSDSIADVLARQSGKQPRLPAQSKPRGYLRSRYLRRRCRHCRGSG